MLLTYLTPVQLGIWYDLSGFCVASCVLLVTIGVGFISRYCPCHWRDNLVIGPKGAGTAGSASVQASV